MPELKSPPKADLSADKQRPSSPAWRRWQWLLAPLLGISVILHIGLLFVPLPTLDSAAEETTEDEETPEADDEAPIDILSLSEIAAPEPPPESPPEPTPEPNPPPQPQPPPPAEVPPPPDPEQLEAQPPDDVYVEEEIPIDDGLEATTPSFDTAVATTGFIGDLSNLALTDHTATSGIFPGRENLRRPNNAVCFINPSGGPIGTARDARWLELEPDDVFRNMQETYAPTGVTFSDRGTRCGEQFYEAYSANGESFLTFSLVQLEGSTLLVIWDTPPIE